MTFEQTPEYIQSINMRPACDRVLCYAFGVTPDRIERFDKAKGLEILDREFAIDMRIHLINGSQLTGQEKALSNKFYKYKTFTMEFYQNRFTKEPGEFFKIASQFYLTGYSDESGIKFAEWKIIDLLKFLAWMNKKTRDQLELNTRPAGGSRASFIFIPYKDIPKEFILFEAVNTKGGS